MRRAVVLAIALVFVGGAAAPFGRADPRIGEKQAEVRRVLAEIDSLSRQLGATVEAYDGATYKLGQIEEELRVNRYDIRVVRANLRTAQRELGYRLRALYESDASDSTLGFLLSAASLDDLIGRLEARRAVTGQTRSILGEVQTFRATLVRQSRTLKAARAAQKRVVAERAAEKARIEDGLAYRRRLAASIQKEIARIRRQDAIRQAELAAAARARLSAQQARTLASVLAGPGISAPASPIGRRVVGIALRYLGLPYVWAAAGPDAFDCSGLVMYVFQQVGISLPHYAASQWNYGVSVSEGNLEPGDLVFFANLDHVGIYVGNGDYVEAPMPGLDVKITSLSDPWAASHYYGAKRIF